jgi:hypothetical protein
MPRITVKQEITRGINGGAQFHNLGAMGFLRALEVYPPNQHRKMVKSLCPRPVAKRITLPHP